MLDYVHRGFYIAAVAFFMAVGMLMVCIGYPEYLKLVTSDGVFKMIYDTPEPKADALLVIIGSIITIASLIIGVAGGGMCRFTRKDIIPKNVDVLRAQNITIFLIDGEVYRRDEASFYILEDLSRIRVTSTRNLYFMELEKMITIAPEGDTNGKEEILLRDHEEPETGKESDADNKEGEDNDKPFK